MSRSAIFTIIMVASLVLILPAHVIDSAKITWTRDVSRIVYRNCASCHHEGGTAISLMTYAGVRPRAGQIREQVCSRRMPPWNAVRGFGEFRNDPSLTQEDIEIIAAWVEEGAPEGNPAYLSPTPNAPPPTSEPNPGGAHFNISGNRVLDQSLVAIGIQPLLVPAPGTLQVIAKEPDGSEEPLIWIENFNSNYQGTYYFRDRMSLPAGTRIEMTPPESKIALAIARSHKRNLTRQR